MPEHIHMMHMIPPRYRVAILMGYLKEKRAVRIHRELIGTKGALFGRNFWVQGFNESTVSLVKYPIRTYIREQEQLDKQEDQMKTD